MSDHYKISAPDGTEYFVSGLPELQKLYREGRIAADILIQKLPVDTWMPMNEMYDLSQWTSIPNSSDQPTSAVPATPYGFSSTHNSGLGIPSTRGMRAAGILLLINTALNFLAMFAIGVQGARGRRAGFPSIFYVIDVLVAINLLRGQWRTYAIYRVVLGAVVWGLITPLLTQTSLAITTGIFQLIFAAGIFSLLYGEFVSFARTAVGIGTVVFCWIGLSIASVFFVIYPSATATAPTSSDSLSQVSAWALPIQHFDSADKSVAVDPPDGWVLLEKDNPIVPSDKAEMIAMHPQSGCYAVLVSENIEGDLGVDPVSVYLSLVEENQKESLPTFTVLNQTPTQFGNNTAQRIEVTWQRKNTKFHGWRSVCKNGSDYYMLSGWCLEGRQTAAMAKYTALEKGFSLMEAKPKRR